MSVQVHIPKLSRLSDYVTMIFEVKGQYDVSETILPQGVVEIIFNFAENITGVMPFSNTPMHAPRCFVQGLQTHLIQASYQGQQHLLGIRLLPHSLRSFLDVSSAELMNTSVDLTTLKPVFNTLWHKLQEQGSFVEKVSLLERELPYIAENDCGRSKMLSHLFDADGTDAFQSVDELAKNICYSTRQLNRVAQSVFGICAEELTTYKKYIHSVKLIHSETRSLTDVAYSSGFYDQAHFCRVFKRFTSMSPNQYRKRKSENPFHIIY
jgi:AraC-like DNA-binding protein